MEMVNPITQQPRICSDLTLGQWPTDRLDAEERRRVRGVWTLGNIGLKMELGLRSRT